MKIKSFISAKIKELRNKIYKMVDYYATTALMPNGEKQKILLEDYQGSYLLLLFYPGDFGPMSKGQILDFAQKNEQFVNNGCQVQ